MTKKEITEMFASLACDNYIDEDIVIDVVDYVEQTGAQLDEKEVLNLYYEFFENENEMYDCDDPYLECGFDPYEGCYTFDC